MMDDIQYQLIDTDSDLKIALEIRRKVFIEEQGISEAADVDGNDPFALHMIARINDRVVATARITFLTNKQAKLERMAVLKPFRKIRIGQGIITFFDKELKKRGVDQLTLHAQYPVIQFYKAQGFKETGQPFIEADIKHIKMVKMLL